MFRTTFARRRFAAPAPTAVPAPSHCAWVPAAVVSHLAPLRLLLLCLALWGAGSPLAAQAVTNTAPRLTINNNATTVGQFASLQVDVCDDHNLNSSSRELYWNGTNVTNSTAWATQSGYYNCAVAARITSSQTSVLGNNTVRAVTCDQLSYSWYPYGPLCTDVTRTLVFRNVDVPDLTAINKPPNRSDSVVFTVNRTANVGSTTYNLTATCSGGVSGCSVQSTVSVTASATVKVSFTTGSANGTGTVTLRATSSDAASSYDDGSVSITNVFPDWMTVSAAQNNNDHQATGACAASCFAATASVSTVPFISMDAPQNITLAYHGDRVAVRPFVFADVSLASGADAVTGLTMKLQRGTDGKAVKFLNGDTVLNFSPGSIASRAVRLAGQFAADSNGMGATGMYMDTLVVTASYADHSETQRIPLRIMVVNERQSPIARGWAVAGLQRLYPQSGAVAGALITSGDGSAVYFAQSGSDYVAPAGEFTSLRWDAGSSRWIRSTPDSTKFYFNSAGLLTSIVTRASRQTDFTYDGQQRLVSITLPFWVNALGRRALTLRYTGNGSDYGLWQVEEPKKGTTANGGRITTFAVNAGDSTLRVVQDPDGVQSTFGYDSLRRLETMMGRDSATWTFLYRTDKSWKLAGMRSPTVAVDNGSGGTVNDQLVTRDTAWQTDSVPTASTAGAPQVPIPTDSVMAVVVDAGGHATRFTVDRWGQPLRTVDALGNATVITRNANGQPTSVLYPTGVSDSFGYSGPFMTSAQVAGQAAPTYFTHGAWGQLTYQTGNGPTVQHFVGGQGRIDSTKVAGAYVTKYVYDGDLRLTHATDPQGHTTQFFYDVSWGNQDSIRTHDGKGGKTYFDSLGRDSASKSAGRATVRQLYDVMNRPTQTFDGVNGTATVIEYVRDRAVRVIDPKGQVYKTDFNALGWPIRVYDAKEPDSAVAYTYTRDGLPATRKNLEGKRVVTTYDAIHRVLTQFDSLAGTRTFSYNPTGTQVVALAQRPGGDTISIDRTFTNATGWTDSVTTVLAGQSFRRHYHRHPYDNYLDSVGVSSPSGVGLLHRRWWQNGSTGRLDSLAVGTSRVKFGYNADGLRTTTTWGTSITRTDGYTADHLPSSVSFNVQALSGAFGQTFALDSMGRIRKETRFAAGGAPGGGDRTTNRTYDYDGLGRLRRIQHDHADTAQVCGPGGCGPIAFEYLTRRLGLQYDPASNLTQETDSVNNTTVTATLLGGNRLQAWGQTSFLYDRDGNDTLRTTPSGTTKFTWSAGGLLLSAISGSDTTYYDYDAAGQLVRKRKPGNVIDRWYLWDQGQLLAELNATATGRLAEYAYFPGVDQPLAMVDGSGGVHWYQQSVIGNVDGLFSMTGTVEQTLRYDDWGVLESSSSSIGGLSALRWKGLYFDGGPTNLYYMRARWYDPAARRFASQDPIGLAGGINPYAFGGNDPVNMSDPTGLYCQVTYNRYSDGSLRYRSHDFSTCGWAPLYQGSVFGGQQHGLDVYRRLEEMYLYGSTLAAGGYPGQSGTGRRPTDPHGYKPIKACPAFLQPGTPYRQRLETLGPMGTNANESGAFFLNRSGGGVRRGHVIPGVSRSVTPPAKNPAGAVSWNHTHTPPYYAGYGQGPSVGDAQWAARRSLPVFAISRDSVFWVNPAGDAYGCAR